MTVLYPEFVSGSLGRRGYFETDMTSMMIDVIRRGMTVYDVGAHLGYFTLLASRLVGTGLVHALEPTVPTFEILCENTRDRSNVRCHNIAAYRDNGAMAFLDQGPHASSLNAVVEPVHGDHHGTLTEVPIIRLDEFACVRSDPDFVKIDAEGSELAILEGMQEILSRAHPAIGIEMGDGICERNGKEPCSRRIEFLLDQGYQVFDYRQGSRRPHTIRSYYEYDNLLFQHPDWPRTAQPADAELRCRRR